MDYPTLLHAIENRITSKMREDFNNEFFEDEYNKYLAISSYKPEYYSITSEFSKFYDDPEDLGFLSELMKLNLLCEFPLEDAQSYAKEINSSVKDLYRFKQLDFERPSSSYDSKLKFISKQYSNYFNVLRTYNLPSELFAEEHHSLCSFSVFPRNKAEIDEYISFLEQYLIPSGDYRDFYGSNQKSTEYFIQTFINRLSLDNCHSFISEYLQRLDQFYPVSRFQDVYAISIDFYRDLKKFNLNINEFLYQTSDPFIYFLTLFFRRLSQPVGEFKYYLETFDWEKEKDKVLYLTSNDIEISPKNGYESNHFEPNEKGKYCIYYANYEQRICYENLFRNQILKEDYRAIKTFFKDLHAEIFNVSHNIESFVAKKIDHLKVILPSLENNTIRTIFLNSIIQYISKSEILQITPLVWRTFYQSVSSFKDEYLKALPPEMIHLDSFSGLPASSDFEITFSNADPDAQINEVRLNDEKFINTTKQISHLLARYFKYSMTGDLMVDLEYLNSLGYDKSVCNANAYFCPKCINSFLRFKTQCDLLKKYHPFETYHDKLDFLSLHRDVFNDLNIQNDFDSIFFSTFPQNKEESDTLVPLILIQNEEKYRQKRLSGQEYEQNIPIVSYAELKCKLLQKARKSPEPVLLLKNEFNRILELFPINYKSGLDPVFWHVHDLMVNSVDYIYIGNPTPESIGYLNYGPLVTHYVNYYFYLKDIIENRQDAFIESTKYIVSEFIYFHVTSDPALTQSEIEKITYSGKYIIEISRPEPIPYIYNIINSNKVLHKNFKAIIDFFMNTKLWEFPIIKPEFESNADGRKIRSRSEDPFNHRNHALEVISFADTLPDFKEILLTEYINLIITVNKHTASITSLISIIKMNISNKPIMAKEDKKKKDRNPFQKFVYAIDIFGKRKTVTISTIYPIYHYHEVEPIFKAAKKYISAKFTKKKTNLERVLFLDDLLINISDITSTNDNDMLNVLNYLKPFNFNFEELMQCTDKRISLYYELTMNDKIIPIIYPSETEQDRVIEQRLTFIRFVIYHFKTKLIEYITDLKEKVGKDKNLKPQQTSNVPATTEIKDNDNAKLDAFNKFMEYFEFPYPYEYNIVEHFHHWKDNLNYVKTEIEYNLSYLETPKSNIYLSTLSRKLSEKRKNVNKTKDQLDKWYDKYNTNEEDALYSNNSSNILHQSINRDPINIKESLDDKIDPDTDMIQQTFHNYHYGQFIDAAMRFIDEVKMELGWLTKTESISNNFDDNGKVKPPPKPEPKGKGFKLLNSFPYDNKFSNFHSSLKKFQFIDVDLPEFRNAFLGTEGYNKIKWLKYQNELNYLIANLIENKKIRNYRAWTHVQEMFTQLNGAPIHKDIRTNNFKAVHTNLDKVIGNL